MNVPLPIKPGAPAKGRGSRGALKVAAACSAGFLLAAWSSIAPETFNVRTAFVVDSILERLPNSGVRLAFFLTTPELQGVIMVALMWGAWFAHADRNSHARIVVGLAAALAAAFLGHVFQYAYPSGPKPLFLPGYGAPDLLQSLFGPVDPDITSGRSFPSERATLFAGMAILTFMAHRQAGAIALGFTLIVETCRVLLGMHYFMDIVGSFCLAGAFVSTASLAPLGRIGHPVSLWESSAPVSFHVAAFIASYQLATTLDGLRWAAALALRAYSHS